MCYLNWKVCLHFSLVLLTLSMNFSKSTLPFWTLHNGSTVSDHDMTWHHIFYFRAILRVCGIPALSLKSHKSQIVTEELSPRTIPFEKFRKFSKLSCITARILGVSFRCGFQFQKNTCKNIVPTLTIKWNLPATPWQRTSLLVNTHWKKNPLFPINKREIKNKVPGISPWETWETYRVWRRLEKRNGPN